jgi:hypothetical protein
MEPVSCASGDAVRTALPCPVCRAVNDAGPACRRCKADLSLCFAVEARRARALADAVREVAAGNLAAALAVAEEAHALRHGQDVRRLQALIHLRRRDFARAWSLYSTASTL